VLSYLRLFALGLASSALAVTFNQLAADAYREFVGGGVLLAAAVLTLGHGVNVALGVIGGLVHGLRLNLIEFLSWSLASEGRPFRRFAKKGRSGA
jgi:V/A-type H+-transporting ATPase subunit I